MATVASDSTHARSTKATPCRAQSAQGQPCRNAAGPSGYCWWHDPAQEEERAAARHKGGLHRRRRPSATEVTAILVKSMQDAVDLLGQEISLAREVAEPGLERLRAVSYALGAWAKLFEVGELAQRIEALEATLKQREASK